MPQAEYIIQTEHTSGSTAKHYHGVSIDALNEWAKNTNNIPYAARLNSVKVYYEGKLSLGDTKFYVGFTDSSSNEPSQKLISDQLTTSRKSWSADIPKCSGAYPFNMISGSSNSILSVYMNSGIIYKKFTCYSFKVIYDYYIPDYTLTLQAGIGGTVTGGGTYPAGTSVTFEAIPDKGYKFKQWSDGETNNPRGIGLGGNVTITAEFEPLTCEIILEDGEGVNGAKATLSGGGVYNYGDTVTIKADIPPYHEFSGWFRAHPYRYYRENPLTITIDDEFIPGNYDTSSTFRCDIEFTGYILKANTSPDNSGAVYWGYMMNLSSGQEYYRGTEIPIYGMLVSEQTNPSLSDSLLLEAIPNKGYEFVQWSDGVTANPRETNLTGDATFTAIFRYVKIDNAYAGVNQSSSIYAGIDEVKAVYVGTTKVYG